MRAKAQLVGTGGVAARYSRRLPPGMRNRALVIAALVTAGLLAITLVARPLLNTVDHWTADFRTAFFTYQLDTQHKSVALVLVDEEAIAAAQKDGPSQYRSPVDRGLLKTVVERLDEVGARAVGLDFIVEQATEPAKDAAFVEALKKARTHIVLARLDHSRSYASPEQVAYHARFLEQAGRASGFVTVKSEIDGVVRTQPTPNPVRATLAEEIAKAAGWQPPGSHVAFTVPSDRIAWLRRPRDNSTTFLTVPAVLLQTPRDKLSELERATVDALKDKLVIVGLRFQDRTDRHDTPLGKAGEGLMPGAEINAHVVAQLVDKRSYDELSLPVQLALSFMMAFAGVIAAWRMSGSGWLIGSAPIAIFVIVTLLMFWQFKLILPFGAPMLAWLTAVYAGRLLGWQERELKSVVQ